MAPHPPLQRPQWSLVGTALLGVLVASAAPALPRLHGPAVVPSPSLSEDELELPAMLQAAGELRDWAWSATDSIGELPSYVDALLAAAANEASLGMWERAHGVGSILEASLRVSGRDRFDLATAARELGRLAPNDALRVRAVRAELRLLESVITSSASSAPAELPGRGGVSAGAGRSDESSRLEARARLEEIIGRREHLEAGSTAPASGPFAERLELRIRTLAVGQRMPRFLARDTAGNEVRSSLLPGQVTIFRLWESHSPGSMLAHEEDARLARTFWDAPVALFGATHSSNRAHHLAELEARSFAGTQLFAGPISTALEDELARAGHELVHGAGWSAPVSLFEAWGRPAAGSLFVVDESGVIRGRDLLGDELKSLVSQLVAERHQRLRGLSEGRFTARSSR